MFVTNSHFQPSLIFETKPTRVDSTLRVGIDWGLKRFCVIELIRRDLLSRINQFITEEIFTKDFVITIVMYLVKQRILKA